MQSSFDYNSDHLDSEASNSDYDDDIIIII